MEKIDKALQQRVWQRVQSPGTGQMPPLGRENIKPWLMLTQENAQGYQQLAKEVGGRRGDTLRQLAQENQRCHSCIRGLCLMRGENVKPARLPVEKEPPRRRLEKCFHRERRLWEEAERKGTDPEFGCIYKKIARQAGERCAAVLELLGKWEDT